MVVFSFGPFLLDPAKRTLLRDGVPQSLTPKAFDLLLLLVEQRGRVLSKDELLKAVWPDTFVDEANLSQQIFMLRRTLGGDSNGQEYIATIPRRGYRFVADAIETAPQVPVRPEDIEPGTTADTPGGETTRARRSVASRSRVGGGGGRPDSHCRGRSARCGSGRSQIRRLGSSR